ncbi:MAG: YidC/Oxa1 family membrane protein insertase [Firmicutes bacterium]|nr:YidC/Oxa1 family membrane protein insertase [Bacillota bacterium]
MFNLISALVFPAGSGIRGIVFSSISWIYSWTGSYGLAIIMFTLFLRVAFIPLDFATKYFTKRNSIRMAELKPEEERLKNTYADDPMGLQRARQEMYKKHGAGMGGFCLFTILNLVVMMVIFINVFQGLNQISHFNVNNQYTHLQGVYQEWRQQGYTREQLAENEYFHAEINQVFNDTTPSFLWVSNMWRPDAPWTRQALNWSQFQSAINNVHSDYRVTALSTSQNLESEYNFIFSNIDASARRWNGFLLFVLLAGATTYFSVVLNAKMMKARDKEKKENEEKEAGYSIRDALVETPAGTKAPISPMDPAMMGKMMKFMMPVIMIIFTLTNTAALAIYITMSSLFATLIGLGLNKLVELIIKKQESKKKEKQPDMTIINPHAKYFKNK